MEIINYFSFSFVSLCVWVWEWFCSWLLPTTPFVNESAHLRKNLLRKCEYTTTAVRQIEQKRCRCCKYLKCRDWKWCPTAEWRCWKWNRCNCYAATVWKRSPCRCQSKSHWKHRSNGRASKCECKWRFCSNSVSSVESVNNECEAFELEAINAEMILYRRRHKLAMQKGIHLTHCLPTTKCFNQKLF